MKRFLLPLLLLFPSLVFAQGGKLTQNPWVSNRQGFPAGGTSIAVCQPLATTAASVTSNLAVFTMTSNPITAGFVNGMTVQVAGFTGADTFFNAGTLAGGVLTNGLTILSVTTTTVTVPLTHANATATSNGTLLQIGNTVTSCAGMSMIYTDASLVTTTANPITADGLGNYDAGAVPGVYYVQYYGSGITTTMRQITVYCVNAMVASCGAGGGGGGTISGTIASGQIAVGSGVNTISGSANLTYIAGLFKQQDSACGLTAIATQTLCGTGSGSTFLGSAALQEVIQHGTPWGTVWTNDAGTGDATTARGTFLGMFTGTGPNNISGLSFIKSGLFAGGISFGGSGSPPANTSEAMDFNADGSIELGINNADGTVSETRYVPNGDVQVYTDIGKGYCWQGTTSGQACIGVPAVAGSPNMFDLPTLTGTNGQCLTTNGGSPQLTSWGSCGSGGTAFPVTVSGTVNSGGIPCFTSTTNEASSASLVANGIVIGGGPGVCPSTVTGLPNGTTATTQALSDGSTKVATDAFVIANAITNPMTTVGDTMYENSSPAPARLSAFTGPAGVNGFLCSPGGGAAAPSWCWPGVQGRTNAGGGDAIAASDRASCILETNGGAVAITLPQAGTTNFNNNFNFCIKTATTTVATITPATSQIAANNGTLGASLVVPATSTAYCYSWDNANYQCSILGSNGLPAGCTSPSNGIINCTNGFTAGTAPVVCGTATGCIGLTEAAQAMTPTANQTGIRVDSTTHYFKCSISGGAEVDCFPLIPASSTSGDFVSFSGTSGRNMVDSGVSSTSLNTMPRTIVNGVSGAVHCDTSTTTETVSTLLAANAIVVGGGAGLCPSTVADFTIGSVAHTLLSGAAGLTDLSAATTNTASAVGLRVPVLTGRLNGTLEAGLAVDNNGGSPFAEMGLGGTDLTMAVAASGGNGATDCRTTFQYVTDVSGIIPPVCNSLATSSNTSQKTESALDNNVLTVTPPAVAGSYRLRFVLSVSAAAAAVVGWTATWTDSNGNAQTPTNLSLFQSGTAAPALTFTTSAAGDYYGDAQIDINNAATNIVIKFTLASGTITAKASATVERVI